MGDKLNEEIAGWIDASEERDRTVWEKHVCFTTSTDPAASSDRAEASEPSGPLHKYSSQSCLERKRSWQDLFPKVCICVPFPIARIGSRLTCSVFLQSHSKRGSNIIYSIGHLAARL